VTILNWALGGLVVGVGAVAVYNGVQVAGFQERLQAAESRISSNAEDLASLSETQEAHSETLAEIGTAEDIARRVLNDEFPELVEAISSALTSDPEKVAMLTGPEGPSPDMDALVARFLEEGLAAEVGFQIWEERHVELAAMPDVLASVAAEVYQTYGEELRGADGAAVAPEDVARVLALDPAFLSLLDLELEAR
jgi:hypothetical protein